MTMKISLAGLTLLASVCVAGCSSNGQPNPAAPTPAPPPTTVTIDIAEMNGPRYFCRRILMHRPEH